MNDDEIRRVVREVLASRGVHPATSQPPSDAFCLPMTMVPATPPGSPCVIEPAVGCNRCGYCVSLGH